MGFVVTAKWTAKEGEEEIDSAALGAFIEQQYKDAKVDPDEIDTGALILTGVAVRRRNARKIGELFARQAGKLVAVCISATRTGEGVRLLPAAAVRRAVLQGQSLRLS